MLVYWTVLYCNVHKFTVLCCIYICVLLLMYIVQRSAVLHCIVDKCAVLHCIYKSDMYYTVLY